MAQGLLRLQAALMDGTEPTFDGQKMQAGIHFRWTFAAELGFPPGGFWLCRMPSSGPQSCIDPPEALIWDETVNPCPPAGGAPGWGDPDFEGWQIYSAPFVLPVTVSNWPARYFGAPNPATPQTAADVQEALRRLGGLKLEVSLSAAQILQHLGDLRTELVSLVSAYPVGPLFGPPIGTAVEGDAPRLGLNEMQKLLLLALNPYMARVLGLYYVDTDVTAGKNCVYALVGKWGNTPSVTRVVSPASASSNDLATGLARVGGLTFSANQGHAQLIGSGSGIVVQSIQTNQLPIELCRITLDTSVAEIDLQIAGPGTVNILGNGQVLATQQLVSPLLLPFTLKAPHADITPIDTITLDSLANSFASITIGSVGLRLLPSGAIGTLSAVFNPPAKDVPLPAPPGPAAKVRFRQAEVVAGPALQPQSGVEIHWAAPPPSAVNDPLANPPPPNTPIGFVAQRTDSGAAPSYRLPQHITPSPGPTPPDSPLVPKPAQSFRVMDLGVPDPKGMLTYQVAGFDSFGVLGSFSPSSAPLTIPLVAPLPTAVRVVRFDNQAASGGHAATGGWAGGQLAADVQWSGPSLVASPDAHSYRLGLASLDSTSPGLPSNTDTPFPPAQIVAVKVSAIQVDPTRTIVTILTTPPLPALASDDPLAMLILAGVSPTTGSPVVERYSVRPALAAPNGVVATLQFHAPTSTNPATSRLIVNPTTFIGQPAYLVLGVRLKITEPVPLFVPVAQTKVRGRLVAVASTTATFTWPPNLPMPDDPPDPVKGSFPSSAMAIFSAPQRTMPAVPAQPALPTPTHTVHHEYFDPADYFGRARRALPFTTPAASGVSGYYLDRASADALFLADIKRRQGSPTFLLDPNPVVVESGIPRADLSSWIKQLTQWLAALNVRRAASGESSTPLTPATVLADPEGRRALVDHFYGGLLDDELRALADVTTPGTNFSGFSRVNSSSLPPSAPPLVDVVDGKGDGRFLYKLQAANLAGSISGPTQAAGPYYTRVVQPPRPPLLSRVQPLSGGVVVAWSLDSGPDTAGYLVYRASSPSQLADLRYFGQIGTTGVVNTSGLATLNFLPDAWPALGFSPGGVDPRIVALVAEPRLIARDTEGSNLAEITLPARVIPSAVLGVYRASDFNPNGDPLNQPGAFNYWRPPALEGTAQLVATSTTQSRLTGLRVGLGRAVPVVVVATVSGFTEVLGQLSARRAAFLDAGTMGSPADPSALSGWTPAAPNAVSSYAVVAVDRFGNRSAPSVVGSAQPSPVS